MSKESILIGLISDTHIPSRGPTIPKHIIEDFKKSKIDLLIHLGDFDNAETYFLLQDAFGKENVIGIRGNMDRPKLQKLLPETSELELLGHKIFMTHGTGGPNIIIKRLNRSHNLEPYDVVLFGHVHRPYAEKWRDGKFYICPGTPTDKRFTDVNSYGYLRVTKDLLEPKIVYL